jgi:hypothetical protein
MQKAPRDGVERQRRLNQLTREFVARAGSEGFSVEELMERLGRLKKRS